MKIKMNRRRILQGLYSISVLGILSKLGLKIFSESEGELAMNYTIHKNNSRGNADHGWLKSQHSFSFASYYNPNRMGFGKLRVINDDIVAPSMGFGTHPHQNMEIISIPLSGALHHKDSQGNETIIRHGEVQIMSAGTGVYHSEYNASNTEDVNFLQIWIKPEQMNIHPRYDQKKFLASERKNSWQIIVSPLSSDDKGIKINQKAWLSLIDLEKSAHIDYTFKDQSNGVYFFILKGNAEINNQTLNTKDAIAFDELGLINIKAEESLSLLAIEVPLS